MKTLSIIALLALAMATGAEAAPKKKKVSAMGEALQRKKSLRFDGRSVEAVGSGRFNSFTLMDEGDSARASKKLYSLPSDFANRASDEILETEYRK